MTSLLIYILIGAGAISMLWGIIQLFKVRVLISTKPKREANRVNIGYLEDHGDQTVPEVHLMGKAKGAAIGRVKIGDNDDNAYVELLETDADDDSIKPRYKTYGYITQEGHIYQIKGQKKEAVHVGYTAKPSKPNEPSTVGERRWKSLWLKCTLNTYAGEPKTGDKGKMPIAVCSYKSFHSSKHDAMPAEARAAAFAYFFSKNNRQDYHEYYNSPAYGWKDTALLAAFIYAIVYVVWYIVSTKVLGIRFIGYKFWQVPTLYAMYYPLWAIVRAIKIECIENSNTIQPKIDLFNKALGQRGFDAAILICCTITLAFTGTYYRFNFAALALVVATAVGINMSLRSSSKRWEIKNPFATDDDDYEDENPPNPDGDVAKTFKWVLDSEKTKNVEGELTLYYYAQYIADLRFANPFYSQRAEKPTREMILEMYRYMKRHASITARVRYTSAQIRHIAEQKNLSAEDTLQFTLDFVQEPNIRYCMNRDSRAINKYEDYIRYPDEVLFDKEADSNSKALLAAMLFHYMGHNVIYLYSRVQHHGAIGIEARNEWVEGNMIFGKKIDDISFMHKGKRYLFCETTSDGFRIGGTMEGMRYDDFDEKVELSLNDEEEDSENSETRIYNWDLDSEKGYQLHGHLTIEFDKTEIDNLRQKNPFKNYPDNYTSYEGNVSAMFAYLNESASHRSKISEIAGYIRASIRSAGLNELDMVQFALDFCQAPNITYCVDEKSSGISYAKEYMRYPDEVLYDKEGDCDCKSSLTAAIFHELGYNVLFMISQKHQHAAIGLEGKDEWLTAINPDRPDSVIREYNGKKYLFCETTGDGYRIGHINENSSIQDFETIVEIKA